jgi:hypothetical protein
MVTALSVLAIVAGLVGAAAIVVFLLGRDD